MTETKSHPDAEFIRKTIVIRCKVMSESCNSYHINHVGGQVRGLMWALLGRDPGEPRDLRDVLKACDIPFVFTQPEQVDIPSEWLAAHGLDDDWCEVRGPVGGSHGPPADTRGATLAMSSIKMDLIL